MQRMMGARTQVALSAHAGAQAHTHRHVCMHLMHTAAFMYLQLPNYARTQIGVIGLLEAVELLFSEGWTPQRTLLFAFGQDEEVGGDAGAGAVCLVPVVVFFLVLC